MPPPSPPRHLADVELLEGRVDELQELAAFLAHCFPRSRTFTPEYLRWLQLGNPDGPGLALAARQGGELVGHVGLAPMRVRVHGAPTDAVLVHDVATAPRLRRQGLCTRLVGHGLDLAADRGHRCAVVVANARSVDLFTRRHRFTALGPLEARLTLARPPAPTIERDARFARIWSEESLRWRLARPAVRYTRERHGDRLRIEADTGIAGIRVELASLPGDEAALGGAAAVPEHAGFVPLRLYLGLDAGRHWGLRPAIDLPPRLADR